MIDLRTDTVSRPTDGMRRAMVDAEVGDEQKGEDPTASALEERMADMLGHEAAVFVPSATMSNQIALRILSEPGDEILAHAESHILRSEVGGPAVHSGLMIGPIHSEDGRFTDTDVRLLTGQVGLAQPRTRIVSIENTHANAGGRVWPVELSRMVTETASELGLLAHLDGARLFNAAVSHKTPVHAWAEQFDMVTVCLSKGLGCPMGALLAGNADRIDYARRLKQLFGGAMRQSGIIAAAGLYALDHNLDRLADDHCRAVRLASGLAESCSVDPEQVDTNCVLIDAEDVGMTGTMLIGRLREAGVLVSATSRQNVVRAVTHIDISDDDIERSIHIITRQFGSN